MISQNKGINAGHELSVYSADIKTELEIPFISNPIHAGFPSPAFDVTDVAIDLNKHLIKHPSATFFARVNGHSMKDAGIDNGDLLIVDKSIAPKNGKIAVCYLDDQFTLKRLRIEKGRLWLVPANDIFKPIEVKEENEIVIWGIVAHVIKSF